MVNSISFEKSRSTLQSGVEDSACPLCHSARSPCIIVNKQRSDIDLRVFINHPKGCQGQKYSRVLNLRSVCKRELSCVRLRVRGQRHAVTGQVTVLILILTYIYIVEIRNVSL